jgi:hypothetical protein
MKASKVVAIIFAILGVLGIVFWANVPGGSFFVAVSLLGAVLGLIPAWIAAGKGRDWFTWWVYGSQLWIVAIIHALCLQPEAPEPRFTTLGTVPAYAIAPPPVYDDPGTVEKVLSEWRRCPWCAETVRMQARVCYRCGRNLA